jgi:putative sigma-54 modulation protein
MQITVTGRQVDITDPIRAHIEKKLGKLDSSFDRVTDVRVVLSVEKYRQFAEITVLGSGVRLHSQEATDDMYASIDKAIDKIERQLRRRTTKTRQAKRRKSVETRPPAEEPEEDFEPEELFEQHGPYRVSVNEEFAPKPMSVEEAIMQLDASGEEFFAFVNEQTDEVNVVFRKKDGGYGLLRRSF